MRRPARPAALKLMHYRELGCQLGCQTEQMARSVDTEPGHFVLRMMEATTGIEPVYAVLQTAPWTTRARRHRISGLAAPRGFEPRFTDPKSAVLPLDDGAIALPQR